MPRKPPTLYDVCRCGDGALIVSGVDLAMARSEAARLTAEAKVINPETRLPTGMFLGEVARYETVARTGLVIA